jgi:hypothetical protein
MLIEERKNLIHHLLELIIAIHNLLIPLAHVVIHTIRKATLIAHSRRTSDQTETYQECQLPLYRLCRLAMAAQTIIGPHMDRIITRQICNDPLRAGLGHLCLLRHHYLRCMVITLLVTYLLPFGHLFYLLLRHRQLLNHVRVFLLLYHFLTRLVIK